MLNLIVMAACMRWQVALLYIISGMFLTLQFWKFYLGVDSFAMAITAPVQIEASYLMLVTAIILFLFLKN